jgi:putative hemolysin
MKHLKYSFLLGIFSLSACAAVYTDASDSNHVTFLNSDGESITSLTPKASAYCAQYGKIASFRKSDTQLVAVFDCNWPQSSPR